MSLATKELFVHRNTRKVQIVPTTKHGTHNHDHLTLRAALRLISRHARGVRAILDGEFDHLSPDTLHLLERMLTEMEAVIRRDQANRSKIKS